MCQMICKLHLETVVPYIVLLVQSHIFLVRPILGEQVSVFGTFMEDGEWSCVLLKLLHAVGTAGCSV